jgi:hypothetical protein
MSVCRLPAVGTLLAVLEEPAMHEGRALLTEQGRSAARRTWERRLNALPATLPAPMAALGQHLVLLRTPGAEDGRAVALASTPLPARGGVGHKKVREAGVVPHTSLETEAHWTTSGGHGWVYGGTLHLLTTVAAVGMPLAAALTPANVADNEQAPALLEVLPPAGRFVRGDQQDNDPGLRDHCAAHERVLVPPKRGAYPHQDDGVEVRRVCQEVRSRASANFNGQVKAIFDCCGPVPTRGLVATRRFAVRAVLVYHLAFLHRYQTGGSLRVGLKPLLKAA